MYKYGTAYIEEPLWARYVEQGMYLLGYALSAVAGFFAVYVTNLTALGGAGWVLAFASIAAFVSTFFRLKNFEATLIWPILAAVSWISGYLFTHDAATTGTLALTIVPGLAVRLLRLNLISWRQRVLEKRG